MKITFIGTGSGSVSAKQNHSSYLIEVGKNKILFDCGDGISKALTENKINFNSITHLIISHLHPDHVSGFPNLINQMHINKRKSDLVVISYKGLIAQLQSLLDITYVFPEKLKFNLTFVGFDFLQEFTIGKLKIKSIKNNHIFNKYKIQRVKKSVFNSASFLFSIGNKKILFTSDLDSPDDLMSLKGMDFNSVIIDTNHLEISDLFHSEIFKNTKAIYLSHYRFEEIGRLKKIIRLNKLTRKTQIYLSKEKTRIVI